MAKMVLNNPTITLNSIDISDNFESAEVTAADGTVTITAFGDTYEQRLRKLIRNWSARLNFLQDYSTAEVFGTLNTIFSSTLSSGHTLTIRPSTAIRGAGNPDLTGLVAVDGDWGLLGGSVGEANKGSVALNGMGTLSILTSSS